MNGVLVFCGDFLVAPSIVPSEDGVISRSQTSGNRGTFVLPIYKDIELGDKYYLFVDAFGGQWSWSTYGTIDSTTEVVTRALYDALFVGATRATAYYTIEKQGGEIRSHQAVYSVVD